MNNSDLQLLREIKILLVDDEDNVRISLYNSLKELCKDVITANDAEEALNKYNIYTPDIIFVDIQMPKTSGLEFIKNIRKDDLDTIVIVLSAFDDKIFLKEAIPLKLLDYIIKPISFSQLMKVLKQSIDLIKKRENNKVYFSDNCYYDMKTQVIYNNYKKYDLGLSEYKLLSLLIENKNKVVSTKIIEVTVWSDGSFTENALKSLLQKLRKKIGKTSIQTLRGLGYKLITMDTGK